MGGPRAIGAALESWRLGMLKEGAIVRGSCEVGEVAECRRALACVATDQSASGFQGLLYLLVWAMRASEDIHWRANKETTYAISDKLSYLQRGNL